jgi:hypothetical protein
MIRTSLIAATALLLSGCAATSATSETATTENAPAALCKNDGLERFVGRTADAALGAEALAASGARTVRWGAPRSPMTMDFRQDRLTVSYDDAMVVIRLSCG